MTSFRLLAAAGALSLVGCSLGHSREGLVPRVPSAAAAHRIVNSGLSYSDIENRFAAARGKNLKDAELDTYIDPSVTGGDRKIAHDLMKFMPANQRGDFVYVAPGNRLISNNPALLKYVTIKSESIRSKNISASTVPKATRSVVSHVRSTRDYSSICSPPNPPQSGAKGPYSRLVSQCGFAGGWAFVDVPFGTSNLMTGDLGYLYLELRGAYGTLVESGYQFNSDTNMQPYMASTTEANRIALTNGSVHYASDEELAIFTGVTDSAQYIYAQMGQLPPGVDPQNTYLT